MVSCSISDGYIGGRDGCYGRVFAGGEVGSVQVGEGDGVPELLVTHAGISGIPLRKAEYAASILCLLSASAFRLLCACRKEVHHPTDSATTSVSHSKSRMVKRSRIRSLWRFVKCWASQHDHPAIRVRRYGERYGPLLKVA